MLAVHDSVRGRAFGLWITIGGLLGNLSHWIIGTIVEGFGERASQVESFYGTYAMLAAFLMLSLLGLPALQAVQRREHAADAGVESKVS